MARQSPSPSAGLLEWGLRQTHERLEGLVLGLDDAQLRWSPSPMAHSLAFVLWHIARCDDNYLRAHIQGRDEIWIEERWHLHWGLDPVSTGMDLPDEEPVKLPLPDIAEILVYARRVWDEAVAIARGLSKEGLDRRVDRVERTTGMTVGEVLVSHVLGHDNRHLGEMEYIKGLLGLRGSVTL